MTKEAIFKKYKTFQPVLIKWLDSVHDSGWKRQSEFSDEGMIEYETIGLWGGITERTVKVYQSRCLETDKEDDYLVDNMMQIPKVAIIKIENL